MKTSSLISTRIVTNDKDLMIEIIQLFIASKRENYEIPIEKFVMNSFSKVEFIKYAKTQLQLFGTEHSGLGENWEDYDDYRERACELFNIWFIH